MSRKFRSERLHCTISAIMDIFAMQYLREPNAYEINDLIDILGDKGMIWKTWGTLKNPHEKLPPKNGLPLDVIRETIDHIHSFSQTHVRYNTVW